MGSSLSDVIVYPGCVNPTHHLKLEDVLGRQAGFILCDNRANPDGRTMPMGTMPRSPMQITQSGSERSDMELPYKNEIQISWAGGRGKDSFSDDRTRFQDSFRMDTLGEFPICGPKETLQSGVGVEQYNIDLKTDVYGYLNMTPSTDFYAFRIKIENPGTISQISMTVGKNETGSAQTFDYTFDVVNTGDPITLDPTGLLFTTSADVPQSSVDATITLPANIAVDAGKDLIIVVGNASGNIDIVYSATDGLFLATEDGDLISTEDGRPLVWGDSYSEIETYTSSWGTYIMYATLYGELVYGGNAYTKLFEYRHAMYAVVNDPNEVSAPKLYQNGIRGVMKSNAANLNVSYLDRTVNPASVIGKTVFIYNGAGENELQPYRTITAALADGTLTVDKPWNIAQDDTTEWVIVGMNHWIEITGHGLTKPVTDICAVGDYIVFAQGTKAPIRLMHAYASGGYWLTYFANHAANNWNEATTLDTAAIYADFLRVGYMETGELVVWRARVDDSKVDYSYLEGSWTGTIADQTLFYFDINRRTRLDTRMLLVRAQQDLAIEQAKADPDDGYLTSYNRQIADYTHMITPTVSDSFGGTPPAGNPTVTISTIHKFLPYYITCGNTRSNITNMIMAGYPQRPYVAKEDSIGSIWDGVYSEIAIPELKWIMSEKNGRAMVQHDVYVYFNMAGGMIERYYEQRLDDVGPNREEGLPRNRQGEVSCLVPYPGRLYAAIDAGLYGYSSVLCYNGLGWHEIYRSNYVGKSITDLRILSTPGNDIADIMFVSEGTGIYAIPIAINPAKQYDYQYFGYGEDGDKPHIITSWFDFGYREINKYFHSVIITSDCTNDSTPTGFEYYYELFYQVDDDKNWTQAGSSGAQPTIEFHLTDDNSLFGKRIRFKIIMYSNSGYTNSPRLLALVAKGIVRLPVKRSWNITFLLEPMYDLNKRPLLDDKDDFYDRLMEWASSDQHATPLLMRSKNVLYDNINVMIDPPSLKPYQAVNKFNSSGGQEEYKHIGSFTLMEV